MQSKKKVNTKKKFSNRLLYTFITLGILILIAGGIYAAINTATDAYHTADKIDFTGMEISPTRLCLGGICKTAWPTEAEASTNICGVGQILTSGYIKMGEDTYFPIESTVSTTSDTCPGNDKVSRYTCQGQDAVNCVDVTTNVDPEYGDTSYSKRDVQCIARRDMFCDKCELLTRYTNAGEDTLSGFTNTFETTDTCGTSQTTAVTNAATVCAITDERTCIDMATTSSDDVYGAATLIGARSCTGAQVDTCDGRKGILQSYTCPRGEAKDCNDYYENWVGYCLLKVVNCRNRAQTVICHAHSDSYCAAP